MDMTAEGTREIVLDNDALLIEQVLTPYFKHARYLKSAIVKGNGDPAAGKGKISASCLFEIPESCYIKDTGHFNSVEFNICYNQMMYYVVAMSVKHQLMGIFHHWQMKDYFDKQLPDILILNFKSHFKAPLHARRLLAEIDFIKTKIVNKNNPLAFIKTQCRFYDDEKSGYAEGDVDLVITNINL